MTKNWIDYICVVTDQTGSTCCGKRIYKDELVAHLDK